MCRFDQVCTQTGFLECPTLHVGYMSYVRLLESAAMLLFLPRRGAGRTPKGQDTRGHRLYVTRLVRHRHPENFQEPSFACGHPDDFAQNFPPSDRDKKSRKVGHYTADTARACSAKEEGGLPIRATSSRVNARQERAKAAYV